MRNGLFAFLGNLLLLLTLVLIDLAGSLTADLSESLGFRREFLATRLLNELKKESKSPKSWNAKL